MPSSRAPLGVPLASTRAAYALIGSAQRVLTVMTPRIDPAFFDQADIVRALTYFVIGQHFTRMRVLVNDSQPFVWGNEPRGFLALARRLTTSIEIRCADGTPTDSNRRFLVADDHSVLLQEQEAATVSFEAGNRLLARTLLRQFEPLWMASAARRARYAN